MNVAAMIVSAIVSVISIVGCLILALRNPEIRSLGSNQVVRLVAIWAAIILGLVLVIQLTGLRIAP